MSAKTIPTAQLKVSDLPAENAELEDLIRRSIA